MTTTLMNHAPPPPALIAVHKRRARRRGRVIALAFALPALLLLGALVVYPVLFSVGRSFFDASGDRFVGTGNYSEMFRDPTTLKAIRNTTIWVIAAPTLLTGLGLLLAVLVEKIRWATAFKLLLFMPMAVSFLAAGIIFRLAYDQDPSKGVLNATVVSVHDAFKGTSPYPTARIRDGQGLTRSSDGSYRTRAYPPPATRSPSHWSVYSPRTYRRALRPPRELPDGKPCRTNCAVSSTWTSHPAEQAHQAGSTAGRADCRG